MQNTKMNIFVNIFMFVTLFSVCELKKNVLLIIVDDLRPALGSYKDKNAFTPNIDLLAKQSVQFNYAYAQQALCAPSRNSLLTSRRPDSLYFYDFYSYWRLSAGNFTTLPQHFKENGYVTASFGKVFHPGASSNWTDDSPYSWSVPPFHPSTEQFKNSHVCMDSEGEARRNLVCPVEPNLQPGGTLPDMETLEATQNFLKKSSEDKHKSFFIAVGFHKPHIPLKYPRKFLEHHPLAGVSRPDPKERPSSLPAVAWNPWTDLRQREDVAGLNLTFPYQPIPDEFTQVIRQSYYAAVSYIDHLVGQLIKTMEREKIINNTIILLTGDHGWSLGEHQEWAKYSNFDVAVQVPLIIYDPDLTPLKVRRLRNINKVRERENKNLVSNNLVELVDIFPTLCELANISVPPLCGSIPSHLKLCTEGESLVPLMLDNQQTKGKSGAFSQYPRPSSVPTQNSDKPRLVDINIMGYSLRTKRYRYTEWVHFQDLTPKWDELVAAEMYDHHIDPIESLNLAGRSGLENIQEYLRKQLRGGWRNARSKDNVDTLTRSQSSIKSSL